MRTRTDDNLERPFPGGQELTAAERDLVNEVRGLILACSDGVNVAAAVRTVVGETFTAVNLQHETGGACAEIVALARARGESRSPPALLVAARVDGVVTPCGRCRQVLQDRFPTTLTVIQLDDRLVKVTIGRLLPLP